MAYYPEEYFNTNQFRRLLKDFEASEHGGLPLLPASEEFVDLAEYYFNNGNEDYAMKIIQRARNIYPDANGPLLFLAREALISRNDIKAAEMYAEQITETDDPEYYFVMAEIMICRGQTEQADELLEEGLLFANNEDETPEHYCLDVAALFIDLNLDEKAEIWLEKCNDREDDEWLELKARLLNLKGEYEKCCSIYNSLLDKNPYSTSLWNELGSTQMDNNDIDEAINSFNFALAIDPDNITALQNKAQLFDNEQNYKESLAIYEKLCTIDKTGTNYWRIFTGYSHFMLEEYFEAIKDFEQVDKDIKADKELLIGHYLRYAYSLIRTGKIEESITFLNKAEDYGANKDEVNIVKGDAKLFLGEPQSALLCFQKAIEESEYPSMTTSKVASCMLEHGYPEVAYQILHNLYQALPDCQEGLPCMVCCCYMMKKTDELFAYLEKAIKYTPEETKDFIGHLFPPDMNPEDYLAYLRNKFDIF